MQHSSNWTDVYGAVHASFEGRSGGHRWLLALPDSASEAMLETVLSTLTALDGKGRTDLVVFADPAAVWAAAQELRPRGVLLLAEETAELPKGWESLDLENVSQRRSAPAEAAAALGAWMDEVPHGR